MKTRIFLVLVFLLFVVSAVSAQEATPESTPQRTPTTCSVSMEGSQPVVTGACSSTDLINLMKSLSSNMGIPSGSINVSLPLPTMVVDSTNGKQTFYPGAGDELINLFSQLKIPSPDLWQSPFNVSQNGYAAANGYYFDQGHQLKCDDSDQGCTISVPGTGYYAESGDVRIPKLGYQCQMREESGKKFGCGLMIVNRSDSEATFVMGGPSIYAWSGAYFNGGNLVDDSNPPQEVKPPQSALAVAVWAMVSNLIYSMTTGAGSCSQSSGCDGVDFTVIFTSGPTIIARWDITYIKS